MLHFSRDTLANTIGPLLFLIVIQVDIRSAVNFRLGKLVILDAIYISILAIKHI